ncbi:MAG TPA: hypothetical protein VGG71_07505 [Chitinophagaceae bacterium]
MNESKKIRNLVAGYNMIANLSWSALNLVPISIFCWEHISLKLLLIFLVISLMSLFLPNSFFDSIQLAKTTSVYKKMGIGVANKFVQNGEFINRLIRKRFPGYKVVLPAKRSVNKLLGQTYMLEKFHFMMLVIFTLVIVYALIKNYWWWAIIILINNILYNVYPNLLQQYIRIKLRTFQKRFP